MEIEKVNGVNINKTNEIDYFGLKLVVPEWARYISTDRCGDIRVSEKAPVLHDIFWYSDVGRRVYINYDIRFKDHNKMWKKSLVKLDE